MSIKGCASDTGRRDATFSVYECPVDGRPCKVLEPLRERMVEDLGPDGAARLVEDAKKFGLPCGSCRKGEQDARNLSGLRLGKHERRVIEEGERPAEEAWMESERAHNRRRREENRLAWAEYHRDQAARHRAVLEALASHHEEQAKKYQPKGDAA